jgi:uncharacterized protein (TIGR02145 family)
MKNKSKILSCQSLILGVILGMVSGCNSSDTNFSTPETGNFTDPRDGKVYKTVKIGDQWIMAENLAFKPDHGSCWAYNNDTSNIKIYGYLYDWETAKNVAPSGWHLPTRKEWAIFNKSLQDRNPVLSRIFGGKSKIYDKLIPEGSSGFNASFGGRCYQNGNLFEQLGKIGDFWSSTGSADGPYLYFVAKPGSLFGNKYGIAALKNYDNSTGGKSVRLFKD